MYVQINLAGNQGTTLGDESIAAVRKIVDRTPAPKGVTAYVTGPAALIADMHHSGDSTLIKITVVTFLVIVTMLLLVYRSVITVFLLLVMVGIELTAARGIVAFLGYHQLIGLSTAFGRSSSRMSHRRSPRSNWPVPPPPSRTGRTARNTICVSPGSVRCA